MRQLGNSHRGLLALAVTAALALTGVGLPVGAQTSDTKQHKNVVQRHPNAASAAAGVAAYKAAKHTGNRRARNGRRRNFAQRHPVVTGAAAAAATHHYATKKHKSQ